MALRVFAALCACSLAAVPASAQTQTSPPRPNILLIVSDDQGYADAGFQGGTDIPTPNLDRLARDGVRCSGGYVTHCYCSPTRAALMTGRYQQRFGHVYNPVYNARDRREGLPASEKLLPSFLGEAGYATGWIGKWHLGAAPELHPEKRGFVEAFGFLGGGHHFLNWKVQPAVEYNIPIQRNGQPVAVTEHLTVAFGHEAAAFVRRHAAAPWFLYLAFNAPHMPHQPTPERLARFASIPDPRRRAYVAQMSLMDDAIGEALAAVRQTGQHDRTLVFFFSDNGGPTTQGAPNGSRNAPLRGGKGDVYEGGVRVPFLVSWPGRLPSGKTYEPAVSSLDVFPTALACAGVPMPTDRPYDGVNLVPFLAGETPGPPHHRLFWQREESRLMAVREGNAKLVRQAGRPDELYDLAADLGETKDLAATSPELLRRLGAALDTWSKEMPPPAFPGAQGREKPRAAKNPQKKTPAAP